MTPIPTGHQLDDCGPAAFVGYLRLPHAGRRWRPAVEGATEAEAWHLLLAKSADHQHADLLVLPEGERP
jgi:hypothetical protein